MKMNRLFKAYSAHLSNQILVAGLCSISNFGILYFTANLFTSLTEASEFLALHSFLIILSSYFSYVLLFRNGAANKLVIDPLFYCITLAMLLLAITHYPDRWMLSVLVVTLMFTKDIFIFIGLKYSKFDGFSIGWSILSLFAFVILVNYYFSIKLIYLLILTSIFTLQLSSIFLFKLNASSIQFSSRPINSINLIFSASAEIMPIVAGYFVNVYTINIMTASEYIDYRKGFALIGLSSLVGSISLVLFSSSRIVLTNYLTHLLALSFLSILVSLYFQESINVIVVTTLLVFSISAVINSYNKIHLTRLHYFYLTTVPALAIIAYIIGSSHLVPVHILLVLSSIQVIYCIISYVSLKFKIGNI
jgi:hypothetical protein